MGAPLILEVTDARGRVQQRHRLDSLPVRIGRSYQCELMVEDPYVDPVHLVLSQDAAGDLAFTDPGSRNGTWEGRANVPVTAGVLRPGIELRIGRSTLRVVAPDHPVPAALPDRFGTAGPERFLSGATTGWAAVGTAFVFASGWEYLGSVAQPGAARVIAAGFALVLPATLWAGCWAFANRLVSHRFRFASHLGLTCAAAVLLILLGGAADWIGFWWPALKVVGYGEVAAMALVFAILIAAHLGLATEWALTRRVFTGGMTSLAVVTVIGVLAASGGFDGDRALQAARTLKPIRAAFIPTTSLDALFADARRLKSEVDDLAAENP